MSPRHWPLAGLLGLCCWQLSLPALAWDFAGHFVVAALAQELLTPAAQAEAARLLKVLETAEPATADFIPASAWLDAQGWNPDFGLMDDWHYQAMPSPPSDQAPAGRLSELSAMAVRTLAGPRSTDFQKALMLRVLLHTVADMHQPLHTISYRSADFPTGDRGGYGFGLLGPYPNLHALWDAAGGQYPYLQLSQWRQALPLAEALARAYPPQRFGAPPPNPHAFVQDFLANPGRWAAESHQIAIRLAYQGIRPNTVPSQAYLDAVQASSRGQLALAGYRLAHLLNASLKPVSGKPQPSSPP